MLPEQSSRWWVVWGCMWRTRRSPRRRVMNGGGGGADDRETQTWWWEEEGGGVLHVPEKEEEACFCSTERRKRKCVFCWKRCILFFIKKVLMPKLLITTLVFTPSEKKKKKTLVFTFVTCHTSIKWKGINWGNINGAKTYLHLVCVWFIVHTKTHVYTFPMHFFNAKSKLLKMEFHVFTSLKALAAYPNRQLQC